MRSSRHNRSRLEFESLELRNLLTSAVLTYDATTGDVDFVADTRVTVLQIDSERGIFVGEPDRGFCCPPWNFVRPDRVFFLGADSARPDFHLGPIAIPNLSESELREDLSFIVNDIFSNPIESIDIVVINEPDPTIGFPPAIAGISLTQNQIIDGGDFSVRFEFNEPVTLEGETTRLVRLQDADRPERSFRAEQVSLDDTGTQLTADFRGVGDGRYNLTFEPVFPGSTVKDDDGNLLDGEWSGSFPTGDGLMGGAFEFPISVDIDERVAPASLLAIDDANSRIYRSAHINGYLSNGNVDEIAYEFAKGHVVEFDIDATADVRMILWSSDTGQVVAPMTIGRGQFGPYRIPETGNYRLAVGYVDSTTSYSVQWTLGAQSEREATSNSHDNNSQERAEAIVIPDDGDGLRSTLIHGELEIDDADWYSIRLHPGERLSGRLIPQSSGSLVVDLVDASGRLIQSFATPSGQFIREPVLFDGLLHSPNAESAANYFLRVSHGEFVTRPTREYSLQAAVDVHLEPRLASGSRQLPTDLPLSNALDSSSHYEVAVQRGDSIGLEISVPPTLQPQLANAAGPGLNLMVDWRLLDDRGVTLSEGRSDLSDTSIVIERIADSDAIWTLQLDGRSAIPILIQRVGGVPVDDAFRFSATTARQQGRNGVIVNFTQPIDRRSVLSTDLTVGNQQAIDVEWENATRAFFVLPAPAAFNAVLSIANDTIRSITGAAPISNTFRLTSRSDINQDGVLDSADIDRFCEVLHSGTFDRELDYNNNGTIDLSDYRYLIDEVFNVSLGDANFDGTFDSGDLVQVFQLGLYETNNSAGWAAGDWNCDGRFDSGDFVAAFSGGAYTA